MSWVPVVRTTTESTSLPVRSTRDSSSYSSSGLANSSLPFLELERGDTIMPPTTSQELFPVQAGFFTR